MRVEIVILNKVITLKFSFFMGTIITIIIGAVCGYIACKLFGSENKGLLVNIFLGIVGGYVGGWVFYLLGITTYSLIGQIICGVVGAAIVLWLFSMISGKK